MLIFLSMFYSPVSSGGCVFRWEPNGCHF